MGTPPQGAGSFSGQQERIAQKGHPGRGEMRERDILLCSVSFFVGVKNGYFPLGVSVKFWYPPLGNLARKGDPPAKGPPLPLREILNSPLMEITYWRVLSLAWQLHENYLHIYVQAHFIPTESYNRYSLDMADKEP